MTTLDKVRQITAEDHGLSIEEVTPYTVFFADLGDSLNVVETIMACEEEFGVEIPDEDLDGSELTTPRKLAAYIEGKLQDRDKVWPPPPRRA